MSRDAQAGAYGEIVLLDTRINLPAFEVTVFDGPINPQFIVNSFQVFRLELWAETGSDYRYEILRRATQRSAPINGAFLNVYAQGSGGFSFTASLNWGSSLVVAAGTNAVVAATQVRLILERNTGYPNQFV